MKILFSTDYTCITKVTQNNMVMCTKESSFDVQDRYSGWLFWMTFSCTCLCYSGCHSLVYIPVLVWMTLVIQNLTVYSLFKSLTLYIPRWRLLFGTTFWPRIGQNMFGESNCYVSTLCYPKSWLILFFSLPHLLSCLLVFTQAIKYLIQISVSPIQMFVVNSIACAILNNSCYIQNIL